MSNNNNPFGDTSHVTGENAPLVLPPFIQWRQGNLTDKTHPVLKNGGWEITQEQGGAILQDSQPVMDVIHGENVVPSYLFEKIHILVLAYRKRWFVVEGDRVRWLSNGEEFPVGAKSKLQVYCVCRELNNEPAIVTTSGLTSKHLQDAMNDHVRLVITPASRLGKTPFGRHHFWLPLASAGKWVNEALRRNSKFITPPKLALAGEVNRDLLVSLFVDKETALFAESLIPEAKAWAEGAGDQPQETQTGPDYSEAPPPEENWNPVEVEDEIPF